jgi:uncharacterized protein
LGDPKEPIRLRGHHLLCLQGFSRHGYSPEFVENMKAVYEYLGANPDALVEIVSGPDLLCECCPHLDGIRCTIDDKGRKGVVLESEEKASVMDKNCLDLLQIQTGNYQEWAIILYKVGQIDTADLLNIVCKKCQWRAFPFCETALTNLRNKVLADRFPDSLNGI